MTMILANRVLSVIDDAFPQYSGRYVLTAAQADSVGPIVTGGIEDELRDWLDENGTSVIEAAC